jgi:transposase InsO family protein
VQRVWENNFKVYGVRKVWRQLRREQFDVARCTVQRLMKRQGLRGVMRGKTVRTTVSDPKAPCPLDHVNGDSRPIGRTRCGSAISRTSRRGKGWVYVALVIDVFARRIVGWKASSSMQTDLVLDALEQALHARKPVGPDRLIHHSDRGVQYVSIR